MNCEKAFENQEELDCPVFVVGPPRSGTTLTIRALGLSPETCYLGETQAFYTTCFAEMPLNKAIALALKLRLFQRPGPFLHGMKVRAINMLRRQLEMERLVRHMFRNSKLDKSFDLKPSNPLTDVMQVDLTPEEDVWVKQFVKKYRTLTRRNSHAWIRVLLKDCSILSQKEVVIEKTPLHVLCLPLILHIFPNAKIIATFRDDLREVLASFYLMVGNRKSLPYITKVCRRSVNCVDQVSLHHPEALLKIRYEEWLEDAFATADRIFNFSGLELTDGVLSHIAEIKKTASKFARLDPDVQVEIDRLLNQN